MIFVLKSSFRTFLGDIRSVSQDAVTILIPPGSPLSRDFRFLISLLCEPVLWLCCAAGVDVWSLVKVKQSGAEPKLHAQRKNPPRYKWSSENGTNKEVSRFCVREEVLMCAGREADTSAESSSF